MIIRRTLVYAALVGQAAVNGFSERMREQVDLDALRHELLAVVAGTVQPAHASLWLRPDASDAPPRG